MTKMNASSDATTKSCPQDAIGIFLAVAMDADTTLGNACLSLRMRAEELLLEHTKLGEIEDFEVSDRIANALALEIGIGGVRDFIGEIIAEIEDGTSFAALLNRKARLQVMQLQAKVAELEEKLQNSDLETASLSWSQSTSGLIDIMYPGATVTSPEDVAARKLDRTPYTGPGRLTVRQGDSAYDIEGTPAFIAAVRAQLAADEVA